MKNVEIADGDVQRLVEVLQDAGDEELTVQLAQDSVYVINSKAEGENAFPIIRQGQKVVVEGNGARIQRGCGQNVRFWTVLDGGELILRDLTLADGKVKGVYGGAICVAGKLEAWNCIIENCEAYGLHGISGGVSGGGGGGGGQGSCGGAIYSSGDVFFTNCQFKGNKVVGGNGGDANPHQGRYAGQGGRGGGKGGGLGGGVGVVGGYPTCNNAPGSPTSTTNSPDCIFQGSFGGGGGGSCGSYGSSGGSGFTHGNRTSPKCLGGGGGGAGAKTLGGFDGTGEGGKAGFGGGDGGTPGASSGSAGGGGGAFGGAICCVEGSVSIRSCSIRENEAIPGVGGRHPWGWPAGHNGQSFGGGVFIWNLSPQNVQVMGLNTVDIAFNSATTEGNVFDYNRMHDAHVAPFLLSKSKSLVEVFSNLKIIGSGNGDGDVIARGSGLIIEEEEDEEEEERRSRNPESDSDTSSDSDSSYVMIPGAEGYPCRPGSTNKRDFKLPELLVETILEQYVGWELPIEDDAHGPL